MLRVNLVATLLLTIFLSGCINNPRATWQVKTGDRTSLAFSGKGSAAGMMMDAYMGGMGVAIGIAIDEGIAKDIAANIKIYAPDFNIVSMVESQLVKKSPRVSLFHRNKGFTQVIVQTYGFHTFPGDGDKVTPWLKVHFIGNGKDILIDYPADFTSPQLAELNDVKTNPKLAYELLDNAVVEVISRWHENLK